MPITIDPIADESLDTYPIAQQQQWMEKIRQMSPSVALCFDNAPMRYTFKMRYQRNLLRVWFTLEEFANAGLNEPLVEVPVVKDRWIADEAEVITYPPMTDEIAANSVQTLFGRDLQARYPDPEVAGGHIALVVAKNNNPVQEPPFNLDRTHASLQKHIAFNRRVLIADEQTAGINSGIGDFLQEMSFEETNPVFVCVGAGHTMRGTQPIGGQVWKQEDREMSAVNVVLDGMDASPESVILSAIAEAVTWKHAMEMATDPNFKRPGQRVVIYPKTFTNFTEVLRQRDYYLDSEGGHEIAYERIATSCSTFENCPIFLSEDSVEIGNWPVLAENLSIWMEQAKQVAVASHRQVLENGPETCNSERVTRIIAIMEKSGQTATCTHQKCLVRTARNYEAHKSCHRSK
jgi:hypothetical protein